MPTTEMQRNAGIKAPELLRRALGFLLAASLLACSSQRPAHSPVLPPETSADPEALLAAIRERESRIRTLRARFTVETSSDGEKRMSDGVLLVKKPDRFRLRLTMALGLTVFDYVSWGERSQISLPFENRIVNGATADDLGPLSSEDLGQAFLRGPNAFPGTCTPRSSSKRGEVLVLCRDASGTLLRQIRIEAKNGALLEETTYDGGEPRMVLRFDNYRPVDEQYLPHHIALWYPRRVMSAEVAIKRYAVNQELADALFEPVIPWAEW